MTSLTSWLSDDNWTGSKREDGHISIKSHPQRKMTQIKDRNDIYHKCNPQTRSLRLSETYLGKEIWGRKKQKSSGLRWEFIWGTRERLKISGTAWSWLEVDRDKAERAGRYWWWNMSSAIGQKSGILIYVTKTLGPKACFKKKSYKIQF